MTAEKLSQEQLVQAVYGYAAQLIKDGLSRLQVESKLLEKGLNQEDASIVVHKLIKLRSYSLIEAGEKNQRYGALWFFGGLAVTVFTFLAASGGGTYILAYGAIVGGAIQYFYGRSLSSKGNRLYEEFMRKGDESAK